jgi:hypothetical protein
MLLCVEYTIDRCRKEWRVFMCACVFMCVRVHVCVRVYMCVRV